MPGICRPTGAHYLAQTAPEKKAGDAKIYIYLYLYIHVLYLLSVSQLQTETYVPKSQQQFNAFVYLSYDWLTLARVIKTSNNRGPGSWGIIGDVALRLIPKDNCTAAQNELRNQTIDQISAAASVSYLRWMKHWRNNYYSSVYVELFYSKHHRSERLRIKSADFHLVKHRFLSFHWILRILDLFGRSDCDCLWISSLLFRLSNQRHVSLPRWCRDLLTLNGFPEVCVLSLMFLYDVLLFCCLLFS